jgi:hypothetical protein
VSIDTGVSLAQKADSQDSVIYLVLPRGPPDVLPFPDFLKRALKKNS